MGRLARRGARQLHEAAAIVPMVIFCYGGIVCIGVAFVVLAAAVACFLARAKHEHLRCEICCCVVPETSGRASNPRPRLKATADVCAC